MLHRIRHHRYINWHRINQHPKVMNSRQGQNIVIFECYHNLLSCGRFLSDKHKRCSIAQHTLRCRKELKRNIVIARAVCQLSASRAVCQLSASRAVCQLSDGKCVTILFVCCFTSHSRRLLSSRDVTDCKTLKKTYRCRVFREGAAVTTCLVSFIHFISSKHNKSRIHEVRYRKFT